MRQDVEFRQWPPSAVTWLKCLLNAASASLKRDTAHEATAKIRQFERPRLQIAPVGKDRKPASLALRHAGEHSVGLLDTLRPKVVQRRWIDARQAKDFP